ncbi:mating-type protein beta 1-domain-containing protein [Coprinopsis sp. MPI-PUGE-AT-0042]|nr:mating-type protein beta 1-domain-containing protein [Coprinopsis sp. MPI-PUGE-AT-0042]
MQDKLDTEICTTLESLSSSFFTAITDGSSELFKFADRWTSFLRKIESCRSILKNETLAEIQSLSTTIDVVSEGLLDFESTSESVTACVEMDVTRFISEDHPPLSSQDKATPPAYVELALKWLLDNLANPYPTKMKKESIAQESKCNKKDIEAWFTETRKRIGWSALRREFFNNKQADILAAAKCFFNDAGIVSFPYPPAVEMAFARVEANAKNLYDSRFKHDDSPSRRSCSRSYPTPEPSPERRSPQPLTPCSSFELQSPTSHSLSPSPSIPSSPRQQRIEIAVSAGIGLLSPASSVGDSSFEGLLFAPEASPAPVASSAPCRKRKRRLSDASGERPAKRLPPQVVPRPQATSNPLPAPTSYDPSFDDWYSELCSGAQFSLDTPVVHDIDAPLDLDLPLEITFSNISPAQPTDAQVCSLPPSHAPQHTAATEVVEWSHPSASNALDPLVFDYSALGPLEGYPWNSASLPSSGGLSAETTLPQPFWDTQPLSFLDIPPAQGFVYTQPHAPSTASPVANLPTFPYQPLAPITQDSFVAHATTLPVSDKTEELRQEVQDLRQRLLQLQAQLEASS